MNTTWATKQTGFTIVELLIVIVVIAILAAVTVVAFRGVQDRANDTAIKSDLQNLAKQVQYYHAEKGEFPKAASSDQTNRSVPGLTLKVSKEVYKTDGINLYYCQGDKSGAATFTITVRSKTGNLFVYTPEKGITQATSGNEPSNCYAGYDSGTYTIAQGYHPNTGLKWADWTNG